LANKKCYLKESCKIIDTDACGIDCWKMLQLEYQYRVSNLPLEYIKENAIRPEQIDREAFLLLRDYKDNVYNNVKVQRCGLFISSPNKGNGKTTWATKILKEYFRQLHQTIESFEKPKGLFVNVPILFDSLRDNISNPTPEARQLERKILEADLVIFDDIGTEAPTKWVKEKLYIYITTREMEGRASIYTSNLSMAQLESEDLLGSRIVDRIYKQVGTNIINLKGKSKRRKQ